MALRAYLRATLAATIVLAWTASTQPALAQQGPPLATQQGIVAQPGILAQQGLVAQQSIPQQALGPPIVNQQFAAPVGSPSADILSPLPAVAGADAAGQVWQGPPIGPYGGETLDGSLPPGPYQPSAPPLPPGPVMSLPRSTIQPSVGDRLRGLVSSGGPAYVPGRLSEFDAQGQPVNPEQEQLISSYYDPFGWQYTYGLAGVQPYKFGWYSKDDVVYVPESEAIGIPGALRTFAWNSTIRYAQPVSPGVIFAWSPEFNGVWWKQPGGSGLPPMGTQLESDLSLANVSATPWSWQIGITPQLNSDFRRTLTQDAFMVDGRAILFWRPAPQLRFALGMAIWDRVHVYAIPYAGLIWTPDDHWEFRLLLPKSRISYFAGKLHGFDWWLYGTGEYEIQAYQIDTTNNNVVERGQWSDYQVALGVNAGRGNLNLFIQGGAILDRQVQFSGPTTDFRVKNAFILTTGILY